MKFFSKCKCFSLAGGLFASPCCQAQLTVQPGAIFKVGSTGVVTLKDMDLVNNGSINQQPGDGKFVMTGSADNLISGSSGALLDVFEIAKTGTAKVSLQNNITIGSSINFTSGLIDLHNYNILLQSTAILNGEHGTSRIIGTGSGYIQITKVLNAPSSVNAGNLGAIITTTQNPGSTIIRRGHTSQTNAFGIGATILRYYDILPANNTSLNATLRINYLDAELNGLSESALTLVKSTDNVHWTDQQFSARDATLNYVEQTGLADFSRWTLSSLSTALPVTFSSFLVSCVNNTSLISWKTAQEQNSSHFDVEKSLDGINWQVMVEIPAAGNSNSEKTYSYTDQNASAEKVFYRIAEYDLNNAINYSNFATISCGAATNVITIHPNPVSDIVWISAKGLTGISQIQVFDSHGSLLHLPAMIPGVNGDYGINVQALAAGIYLLRITVKNGNEIKTLKFMKR